MNIGLRESENKAEFGKRLFDTEETKVVSVGGREFFRGVLQSEGKNRDLGAFDVFRETGIRAFDLNAGFFAGNNSGWILNPVKDAVANLFNDIVDGNRRAGVLETMTAVIAGCGRKQGSVGSQDVEAQESQLFDNRNQGMKDLLIERFSDTNPEIGECCFTGDGIAADAGETAVVFATQRIAQDETKIFDGPDSIQVAKQVEEKERNGIIAGAAEDGIGIGRNGADEREINDGSDQLRHAAANGSVVVDMDEFLAEFIARKPAGWFLGEWFTVTAVNERIDIPELSDNIGNCEASKIAHVRSSGVSREALRPSNTLPGSPFLLVQLNPSTSHSDESIGFFGIHKHRRNCIAETVLRLTAQGVDVNVFDGLTMSGMFSVHSTAALSVAEINPVGSLVASSTKTSTLHQGFDQQRAIAIQAFPVIGQMAGSERKNHTGQSANGNIGWDQESTVGDNELEILFPLFGIPSDPGIARSHFPGGTGKLQTSDKLSRQFGRFNDIVQVSAKRDAIVEIMPAFNELFKGRMKPSVRSLNKAQRQRHELPGTAGDGNRWITAIGNNNLPWSGSGSIAKSGKNKQSIRLEMFKESTAFFMLQLPVGPLPFQQFTQGLG